MQTYGFYLTSLNFGSRPKTFVFQPSGNPNPFLPKANPFQTTRLSSFPFFSYIFSFSWNSKVWPWNNSQVSINCLFQEQLQHKRRLNKKIISLRCNRMQTNIKCVWFYFWIFLLRKPVKLHLTFRLQYPHCVALLDGPLLFSQVRFCPPC